MVDLRTSKGSDCNGKSSTASRKRCISVRGDSNPSIDSGNIGCKSAILLLRPLPDPTPPTI